MKWSIEIHRECGCIVEIADTKLPVAWTLYPCLAHETAQEQERVDISSEAVGELAEVIAK